MLMRSNRDGGTSVRSSGEESGRLDGDVWWPPLRHVLHRTTVEILSLHQLPKVSIPQPSAAST
eukprot:4986364-Prymnesium_polylepis.1